jgi:multicomponent Na+:H+ antiporter subunit A
MLEAVLFVFAAAMIAPFVYRLTRHAAGWFLALVPLGLFVYFASMIAAVAGGRAATAAYRWVPSLGVDLAFHLDGLGLVFALLISGVGVIVVAYAGGYLAGHPQLGRFYTFILLFMGSMLGLVLVDNAITMFVFWELTSLTSYFLIGFEHGRAAARTAALQALLVTGGGGLSLLAGLLILGEVGGSLRFSDLLSGRELIQADPLYAPIVILILLGAFTKSAQVPFHFWLPSAMAAPAPVSAYLHSATMVKAGVYLLARLNPLLGGTEIWSWSLAIFGGITMIVGAIMAVRRSDFKLMLAYSTVSALGLLTLLLGVATPAALEAAFVFLLGHAFYKGALFLAAGAVEHETGIRDAEGLGGLARSMPITAGAAALSAFSMAGLPPFLGFVGKEMFYVAALESPVAPAFIVGAALAAGMLFVAVAASAGVKPFIGERIATPRAPHEPPFAVWLGPALLTGLGLGFGLFPTGVESLVAAAAAAATSGEPTGGHVALWHGFNLPLLLSALTFVGGIALYAMRGSLRGGLIGDRVFFSFGPERWYQWALAGLNGLARLQTRWLQSGYLRYYLLTIIVSTVFLAGHRLLNILSMPRWASITDVRFYEWVPTLMIPAAALVCIRSSSRLSAVAALGVVGYGVALIYVLFGAPDLAMTQFMVETLMVVLFVLVLYHLPRFAVLSTTRARGFDAAIALSAGALITALILIGAEIQLYEKISGYFVAQSSPLAHGRNIVNVILVDFRGLDTLGEITVLALAGIGVYTLLKLRLGGGPKE